MAEIQTATLTPSQTALLQSVSARLDPKAIVTDPVDIDPWLHDWRGRFHGAAPAYHFSFHVG